MAKPRVKKLSRRERDVLDGILPAGTSEIPIGEPGAFFTPLSEETPVEADTAGEVDGSTIVEVEGPPEGPIPRASLAHSVPQQPGTNWFDLTVDQRMAAFDKAARQNRDNDHSNDGGPETVEVGNATHINYLRRTR